jgi:hypothetical protein
MKVSVKDVKSGRVKSMSPRYAKILTQLGRATYLTRDMVADPTAAAGDAELDSAGQPWNEALHASTKIKNADGTWRKRPGAKAAE